MKVLMVTPYFYPEVGGVENYVYNISKNLTKSGFVTENPLYTVEKMMDVVVRMKTREICTEKSFQNLLTPRKQSKKLRRRKRYMEEESYRCIRSFLPYELWE